MQENEPPQELTTLLVVLTGFEELKRHVPTD